MMTPEAKRAFIRENTQPAAPAVCPEVRLFLTSSALPLWEATEAVLQDMQLPPPFWAFAWPGSQAIARYLLDHPRWVAGKTVMDFAAGCGLAAIAAAFAGARKVTAVEVDPFAVAAVELNAALNGVSDRVASVQTDLLANDDGSIEADIILVGDAFYERKMAQDLRAMLEARAAGAAVVLIGDPGRHQLPEDGLEELASYRIPTHRDLEDVSERETAVWRLSRRTPRPSPPARTAQPPGRRRFG